MDDGGLGQLLAGPSVCSMWPPSQAALSTWPASPSFPPAGCSAAWGHCTSHPPTPTFRPVRETTASTQETPPSGHPLLLWGAPRRGTTGRMEQAHHTPCLPRPMGGAAGSGQRPEPQGLRTDLWQRQGSQPRRGHTAPAWPSPSGAQGAAECSTRCPADGT